MNQWFVMFTNPKKEAFVNGLFQDRGLETFFPYIQFDRGYGRGIRIEPFFPNYLFFCTDLQSRQAYDLQFMPGVRGLVRFDGQPSAVPDGMLEALRKRLERYADKIFDKASYFHPGQELIVDGGPFNGLEAIFREGLSGRDRAQVMLNLLGKWTRAEIPYDHLKPRNQAALPVP